MTLIDGFPMGRSAIGDSPAPLRPAATGGAAPDVGKGAAFGDILSEVSRGDGVTEPPPAPLGGFDAAAPASIRGTFTVKIGAAIDGDRGLHPPTTTANAAGEAGSDGAASATSADAQLLTDVGDRSMIAKFGAGNSGLATTLAGGAAAGALNVAATRRPAQTANPPVAATLALQNPAPGLRRPSATDAGDASATKRRVNTEVSTIGATAENSRPANPSLANSNVASASRAEVAPTSAGGQAAGALAMTAFFGAGAPGPASFSPGQTSFAPDSASASKSSVPNRGASRARAGELVRSGGAATDTPSDPSALQSLTQSFSAAAAGAPLLSPEALLEGAASNSERATSTSVASNAGFTQLRAPPALIAAQASKQDLEQGGKGAPAPATGNATRFRPIESAPLPVGAATAATRQNPVRISVLDREMHFPPLASSSPVDQIANRIFAEASQLSASATPAAGGGVSSGVEASPGAAAIQPQASLSATRVLNLQLEPEGLGAVNIRMRLSGDRLDLQVEATRPDTMRRIGDDRDLLVEKLRSAGYAMDHVVVRAAEPQAAQAQHGLGSGESFGSEGGGETAVPSPGMSQQQGGSSANEGSGARRNGVPPGTQTVGAEDHSIGRDNSGAVYL
jgi:hypothetical protein